MNRKNILVAIGILGIGFILYKLLLGFVLPIALFVSLGYVLKFLLKGQESDPEEESSTIITNNTTSSPIENVVEIKPIEEANGSDDEKSAEKDKSSQEDISKTAKENKSLDG